MEYKNNSEDEYKYLQYLIHKHNGPPDMNLNTVVRNSLLDT